ncbi:MAG TPA: nuclear transport factor 2 family protein [Pyrinomonadaceae bacterium]|nr:nuclear transport factor 2 family protein [Pyrinomonadaceae bacterium]
MLRLLSIVALLFVSTTAFAQTAPDAAELTKLLNDFLAGAGRNDAAIHDRFWAEDLIYTGAAGRRVTKADIMKDVRSAPPSTPGQTISYSSEDVRIQQYGDTAVVAFRLVSRVEKPDSVDVTHYFNTGTFLKRDSKWQVVSWQATRLPRDAGETTRQLLLINDKLGKATLAADVKTLEEMLDETFIWTQDSGFEVTKKQFVDHLRTGRLKFSQLENRNVMVAPYGETAIVRGATVRRRSAIPSGNGGADAAPYTAFYTLNFVNKGGAWKAVALHTSRQ